MAQAASTADDAPGVSAPTPPPANTHNDTSKHTPRLGSGAAARAWRARDWESRFDSAAPEQIMAALVRATDAFQAEGLVGEAEATQLRQVCFACSAQEAVLLSAALAAYPDTAHGKREFLAILRTVANKPVPAGNTLEAGLAGSLPATVFPRP